MKSTSSLHIHFVCTGNIYRSRLAEAYLRSKQIPNLLVSSSGTHATAQHKGPIMWVALRLLYRYNLLSYMTTTWSDTTSGHITNADIVVFIGKKNYEFCKNHFPIPKKYVIWGLPDFDDRDLNGKPLDIIRETDYIKTSEKLFSLIQEKIDNLITGLNGSKPTG